MFAFFCAIILTLVVQILGRAVEGEAILEDIVNFFSIPFYEKTDKEKQHSQ